MCYCFFISKRGDVTKESNGYLSFHMRDGTDLIVARSVLFVK